jgi:hypothetical protein
LSLGAPDLLCFSSAEIDGSQSQGHTKIPWTFAGGNDESRIRIAFAPAKIRKT